jgi:hypothetical protein
LSAVPPSARINTQIINKFLCLAKNSDRHLVGLCFALLAAAFLLPIMPVLGFPAEMTLSSRFSSDARERRRPCRRIVPWLAARRK